MSSKITQKQMYQLTWYKNASLDGGAMAEAIANCGENEVVVHSQHQRSGRMWASCTEDKLLKMLTSGKCSKGNYEVITDYPHKLYFDVDCDKVDHDLAQKCKKQIRTVFPDAKMAISGSVCTEKKKTSLHICVYNYLIKDSNDREFVKHVCKRWGSPWD